MLKPSLLPLKLQMFAENPDTGTEEKQTNEETEEKLLSQEEVNRLVAQAKSKAKEEATKQAETDLNKKLADKIAEAEKLAKMNADEKKEYDFKKLQDELADLKRKDAFYGLSKEASKMLSEHDIFADDEVLSFVVKEDAEATKVAVDSFVKLINTKVQEGVKQALAGKTPKANATPGQTITKQEILEIKDSFERKQKIAENPHLFKK